jgi:hypothetical protein
MDVQAELEKIIEKAGHGSGICAPKVTARQARDQHTKAMIVQQILS